MTTKQDWRRAILPLALIACASWFAGCSSEAESDQNPRTGTNQHSLDEPRTPRESARDDLPEHRSESDAVSYDIIKDERLRNIKRSVDVRLPRAVSETDLKELAQEIHATDPGYDRTFIVWLLPGMEPGAGAWATTHFDPTLEVRILGLSVEESRLMIEQAQGQSDVEGRWLDTTPYIGGTILLRRIEGELVITHSFKDGSELRRKVRERQVADTRRLDPIEDVGEYYVIRANGDLEMHDDEGLIKSIDPL